MVEEISAIIAKEAVDNELVEKAYQDIYKIFSDNAEKAIMAVGSYLVENFYGNNIELARDKKKCMKRESLNQLIKRLDNRSSHSPSKSWIYQAIGLVVQEEDIKKLGDDVFQMYGKLLISHKVCLLSIKPEDAKKKKALIKEIVEKKLTVEQIKEKKKELIPKQNWNRGLLSAVENPKFVTQKDNEAMLSLSFLKNVPTENLKRAKEKSVETCKKLADTVIKSKEEILLNEQYIERYQKLIGDLETAIKDNTSGEKIKKIKDKK